MMKLGVKKTALILLTVALFGLMVKLGFWQLERGNQKLELERKLQLRADAMPIAIEAWQEEKNVDSTGVKISLTIAPLPHHLSVQRVYWDNQTWQGKVGYIVFQPVRILASDQHSLLQAPLSYQDLSSQRVDLQNQSVQVIGLMELGFVPAGRDRQILPSVVGVEQRQTMVGRLYRKQVNPMSQELMPEIMGGNGEEWLRVQNLSLSSLSQHLLLDEQSELFPYVVQPMQPLVFEGGNESVASKHLPHPWRPLPMASKRHFGYAVQWFSMASVLLGLAIWFAYRLGKVKS